MAVLSVVVPVYNCVDYIKRCIDSVIAQSLSDIEIIIVDDGSTDGSAELIDEIAQTDKRIRSIHKENGGQTSARLAGVRAATAECIGFVDSDDFVDKQMFETLYIKYTESGCDLISSGIIREYTYGRSVEVYDNYPEGLHADVENEIFPSMLYDFNSNDFGLYCTLINKLFERKKIESVMKSVDERIIYGEDAAVFYRYCMRCRSIYILKKAFYHYNIRTGSSCGCRDMRLVENTYRLYDSLRSDFEKSTSRDVLMRQLKRYVLEIEAHMFDRMMNIHPGVLNRWEFELPQTVLKGKFLLYGAGGCGQAFYHYLRRIGKEGSVIGWVDGNTEGKREQCDHDVMEVEDGVGLAYDYIVIAIKDCEIGKSIREQLILKYNLKPERIVCLKCEEHSFFSEALY